MILPLQDVLEKLLTQKLCREGAELQHYLDPLGSFDLPARSDSQVSIAMDKLTHPIRQDGDVLFFEVDYREAGQLCDSSHHKRCAYQRCFSFARRTPRAPFHVKSLPHLFRSAIFKNPAQKLEALPGQRRRFDRGHVQARLQVLRP